MISGETIPGMGGDDRKWWREALKYDIVDIL
jgi:hypothetical protein